MSSRAIKGDMNLEQGAVAERTAQVAVLYEMRAPEREATRLVITCGDDEGATVLMREAIKGGREGGHQ